MSEPRPGTVRKISIYQGHIAVTASDTEQGELPLKVNITSRMHCVTLEGQEASDFLHCADRMIAAMNGIRRSERG